MRKRTLVFFIYFYSLFFNFEFNLVANPLLLKNLKKDIPIQRNKRRPIKLYKRKKENIEQPEKQTILDSIKQNKLKVFLPVVGISLVGIALLVYLTNCKKQVYE